MVDLIRKGAYLLKGRLIVENADKLNIDELNQRLVHAGVSPLSEKVIKQEQAKASTIANKILNKHNTSEDWHNLKLKFDALTSHDITYVGIIQTAIASGLKEFPVPYVLTNCHNSLGAVGGTINEDDHVFGLSAARKYGGIYVPAHMAVIHQYMREMLAGCGQMILGSDSHTRYGALGTMAIGEGGPELVKQLLGRTYEVPCPEVVAIYLEGEPIKGVGPQDVALAIIGAVFKDGFVKNKVMEFVGPGVRNLSVDFRNGIDVMTTETTCLSSIWQTDEKVERYFKIHGRPEAYQKLEPGEVSYYDGVVKVDLNKIVPMIALPFHPSNVYTIAELNRNAADILHKVEVEGNKQLENSKLQFKLTDKLVNGHLMVDQGVVVGCSGGTFENIAAVAQILEQKSTGNGNFSLSVYPASQPVFAELMANRSMEKLIQAGTIIRTAFCGPCFGAGDTPTNNGLSIRHATRNFPNREGSKPDNGQIASVALMDARSIAATAINGGLLTSATDVEYSDTPVEYKFDKQSYTNRVYQGFSQPRLEENLKYGPGIANWPEIRPLPNNLLLQVVSVIHDAVTTTDELIPSGETSSYRSNPFKLAEFTLSRKDPAYVGKAKAVQKLEVQRQKLLTEQGEQQEVENTFQTILAAEKLSTAKLKELIKDTGLGSVIFAIKPGDGSAREQAASCQRVLGGDANIAIEYATKRYRSNVINWGMIPFTIHPADIEKIAADSYIFIPNIRQSIKTGAEKVQAFVINERGKIALELKLENLAKEDRDIILAGCLINYYAGN
ncbi:hydratase [Pelosinus propionicus]|uniref:Aconitate hydratase n=1 Tax=Pelosinus propionicus DSM 13327 TaxID=1123291 RepID=A0A1I4NKU2_9FIRM|nr:hydratase [Pelosinus propionicus]SFM15793.1 aconitate hydratase [Pelosinus propionicus DSM 13327]